MTDTSVTCRKGNGLGKVLYKVKSSISGVWVHLQIFPLLLQRETTFVTSC